MQQAKEHHYGCHWDVCKAKLPAMNMSLSLNWQISTNRRVSNTTRSTPGQESDCQQLAAIWLRHYLLGIGAGPDLWCFLISPVTQLSPAEPGIRTLTPQTQRSAQCAVGAFKVIHAWLCHEQGLQAKDLCLMLGGKVIQIGGVQHVETCSAIQRQHSMCLPANHTWLP